MGLGLNGSFISDVLNAFLAPLQEWLSQHPQISWFLANPVWLLVAFVMVLFLLAGLLRAVSRLTEKLWLGLLKFPFQLVRWVWQGSWFLLSRPLVKQPQVMQSRLIRTPSNTPSLITKPRSERLTEVLNRLEALRQEEDTLMQEMKSLLDNELNDDVRRQS